MPLKKSFHLNNGFRFFTVENQLIKVTIIIFLVPAIVHNQLEILFAFISHPITRMIEAIREGFGIDKENLSASLEINDITFGRKKSPSRVTGLISMLYTESFGVEAVFQQIGYN